MSFEEKAYLDNSYLDIYKSKVTSCKLNSDNKYEVILDKTIFYPDLSGGQPKDEGTINGIEVIDVYEENGNIIHILDKQLEGTVELKINFERRFDHMQQHTGQHLLSCAFNNLYNARTIGFHLSGSYTTIDLNVENFTKDMIKNVELYANQMIYDNLEIKTQILEHDEALKTGLRKKPVDDELIRLVKIGDKDNVACCGTHLNHTGEVGIVKIVKHEKYKSGTRVEFLCGKRALTDYIEKNNIIHELSNSFSCHPLVLIDNIEKFRKEKDLLNKKNSILQNKITEVKVNELINTSKTINNEKHIVQILDDVDMKQARFIATNITENDGFLCGFIIITEENCGIIIAQSSNLEYNLKEIYNKCAEIIGAKGGGSNRIIQGTSNNTQLVNKCFYVLNQYINGKEMTK